MTIGTYIERNMPLVLREIMYNCKEDAERSYQLQTCDIDTVVGRDCVRVMDMAALLYKEMPDVFILQGEKREEFWRLVWKQCLVFMYG